MTTLYIHPDYNSRRDEWVFNHDMFEGKHSVLTSADYLHYHLVESNQKDSTAKTIRGLREQRTRYLKFAEILNSLWCSFFFRKPMKFDPAAQKLLTRTGGDVNIDGKGKGFETFFKNVVTPHYLNYGKVLVLCDSFGVKPKSKKEQEDLKIRPYLECLSPLSVPDWDIEYEDSSRIGKYNQVRYEYDLLTKRSLTTEPKQKRITEVLSVEGGKYTITRYAKSEKPVSKGTQINKEAPILNGGGDWEAYSDVVEIAELNEIPIAVIDDRSWLNDANQESIRYHNLRSNRDNILHQGGYDKIFIIGVKGDSPEQIKALSEFVWPLLPKDASVQSIGATDTSSYDRVLEESMETVFKIGLNQLRSLPASSKESMSFDAMMQEKDNMLAEVDAGIADIERVANESLQHFALMAGEKNFTGRVEMYRDSSPMAWDQFIQIFQGALDVFRKYPEIEKLANKRLVSFMGFSEDDQNKALNAIEKGPTTTTVKEPKADPVDAAING